RPVESSRPGHSVGSGTMTFRVKTVTLPSQQLFERVAPWPAGITVGVWDFESPPVGVRLADIDAVVLPYMNAGPALTALKEVPRLALVQTQSTGYDGVAEAVGPQVAIATASGVHAAATAE